MRFTREEINHLRDGFVDKYHEAFQIEPGSTITLRCEKDQPIVINEQTYYGCGEVVSRHEVHEDPRDMWELVADLYILHLHNTHSFGDPFEELDDI